MWNKLFRGFPYSCAESANSKPPPWLYYCVVCSYGDHPRKLFECSLRQIGILQFGTEIVTSADGTMAGLLGASPGASVSVQVAVWAGSGRYRKGPQNPHRIFVLPVSLLFQLVVVCWYVNSRTWDTHRGRGLMCQIDV